MLSTFGTVKIRSSADLTRMTPLLNLVQTLPGRPAHGRAAVPASRAPEDEVRATGGEPGTFAGKPPPPEGGDGILLQITRSIRRRKRADPLGA
ncbi:hypothetical protein Sme01_50570 [Sphaerisporangium melleum]|uniref:Uncharacterized protein n=1 Tax=Sphaerisporangium melleum TaxID=321316 RepID=A0A917VJ52_9ACTN|nr:hypothetical protein GCM10007964_35980 [Sphaerisporangium melleum]GII72581.1 hypothetical protein Sme01_50570 [Sphaerisporangium melleum]